MGQIMVMVFRRAMALRPVVSTKHVVDNLGGLSSTANNINFATTVTSRSAGAFNPSEVVLGSSVKWFYVSVFIIGSTGAPLSGPIDWYIAKARDGQITTSFPDPGQTGNDDKRNQIIHEEKGLSGSGDGTPMVFKGVIKIPRGMQRARNGDIWTMRMIASGSDAPNFCVKIIYKEYQ